MEQNELLQSQLASVFGAPEKVPAALEPLLQLVAETYDRYENSCAALRRQLDEQLAHKEALLQAVQEHEKTEQRLLISEMRLRQVIDLLPHFIYAKDLYGRYVLANKATADVFGTTVQEVMGKTDAELTANPHDAKHFVEVDLQVLNSGKGIFDQEETITDREGRVRVISTSKIPYTASGTDVPAVLGVSVDITDRKEAKRELQASVSLLEATIESTADGILVADYGGGLARFNKKFVELWRMPQDIIDSRDDERAIAYVLDQLVNPDEFLSKVLDLYVHKEEVSFDVLYFKDGRIFERYSQPQMINGEYVGRVWSFRDVTEQRRAEETLRHSEAILEQKNRELENINRELEQFAYVASHDLQEPLRTIVSFVEMLQQRYGSSLDADAGRYLSFVAQAARRMQVLIKDLLDFSRIGRKTVRARVDCSLVLAGVLADLATALEEAGASVTCDPLPTVSGYPTELKQLFQNLIINAIKFRKKDVAPRVHVGVHRDGACWQFYVTDNGIGIDEQHKDRIFVIFQRLHTRSEYEGSGIGLSHCKKIVELHGGTIWVKGVPGVGSTFYFTIPAQENL